jgi:hypothetical protein
MLGYRPIALVVLSVAAAELAFSQGYGGPSMLSRGGNSPGRRGRAPASITVYGSVRGTVDSGLTPVQLTEDGTIATQTVYGYLAEIGAYGTHSWRRTMIGLDYRGDYRQTTRGRGFSGTNQALSFDLLYQPNRRIDIFAREMAGTTNRAFGGFAAPVHSDLSSLNLANDEVFDTRMYFNQTTAGVSFRTSARTAFIGTGDGFFIRRPDGRLTSMTGYRGTGAISHRLNSRTTAMASYQYMVFQFPRVFGGSDMHGLLLGISRRVTRNFDVNLQGGALRVSSFGTQRVNLSPEVAALLGRQTGVEAFTRQDIVRQVYASIGYTLERSRFSASYLSGISPGNGVYLTSQRDAIMAGYSFSGIRRMSLGASARRSWTTSKTINVGTLSNTSVGGGLDYKLTRLLSISSQLDYRTFRTQGLRGREGFAFSLGLTVSPTRLPLSIW